MFSPKMRPTGGAQAPTWRGGTKAKASGGKDDASSKAKEIQRALNERLQGRAGGTKQTPKQIEAIYLEVRCYMHSVQQQPWSLCELAEAPRTRAASASEEAKRLSRE